MRVSSNSVGQRRAIDASASQLHISVASGLGGVNAGALHDPGGDGVDKGVGLRSWFAFMIDHPHSGLFRSLGGFFACLVVGAALSVWLGQDANWDLLHYHLYDPMALVRGTWRHDVAAAGMQGYFNPLMDVPYATLALGPLARFPRVLAAIMGLWTGLLFWLGVRISGLLHRGWIRLPAVLLAVTGVATIGQTGATFNEVAIATMVLGGLAIVLRGLAMGTVTAQRMLGAGLLIGIAAGLKPTAAPYAAALCLALVGAMRPGALMRAWVCFTAGWGAGVGAAGGWWGWHLWRSFGNPVFPLFNGVFRSPWYPPANFIDARRIPTDWLHWLFAPVWWAWAVTTRATEAPSNDPRLAIALLLGYAAIAACALRRGWPALPAAARVSLAFTALAYAAWLGTSGIGRYAVPIEVMAGLCVPLLLGLLWPGRPSFATLATTAALLGAVATTHYARWGRTRYHATTITADTSFVAPGTLFVVLDAPSSYIVPLLPHQDSIATVGLLHTTLEAEGWRLHDAALARVSAQTGPIMVLRRDGGDPLTVLAELGLSPALGDCHLITSTYEPVVDGPGGVLACEAHKAPPPLLTDPFWAAAGARYHTVRAAGPVWPFTGLGYLQAAGPQARGTRFIDGNTFLWGFDPSFPTVPDDDTLYILGDRPPGMQLRPDDAVLHMDGVTLLAPGWKRCAPCLQAKPAAGPVTTR